MKLKICHMYNDVLNLYGDRGNVLCLQKRLFWRGIESELVKLPVGEFRSLSDFDIVFIGGGQDFEQEVLLDDLHRGKDREIKAAIEDGVSFLTICGGYQMMGNSYKTYDGVQCDFIGAVDLHTVGGRERMIGNYKYLWGDTTIVGFENHSGKTYLGAGVQPLGKVLSGFGNNGEDGTEGVQYKNLIGTYSHGPLLPKNPALADHILLTALARKYGVKELEKLDDTAEILAHDTMCERI